MKIVHVELYNCFLLCKHITRFHQRYHVEHINTGVCTESVDKTKYCQYCTDAVTTVKLIYIFFTNNAIELMVNLFSP